MTFPSLSSPSYSFMNSTQSQRVGVIHSRFKRATLLFPVVTTYTLGQISKSRSLNFTHFAMKTTLYTRTRCSLFSSMINFLVHFWLTYISGLLAVAVEEIALFSSALFRPTHTRTCVSQVHTVLTQQGLFFKQLSQPLLGDRTVLVWAKLKVP